ncbi:hypothetical protein EBZ37_13090 [bacterium]|nr:hypothetical protein [bacterium]
MTLYVQKKIDELVDAAPGTLDTLKEIALALNNDPHVYTTLNNAIGSFNTATNTRIDNLAASDIDFTVGSSEQANWPLGSGESYPVDVKQAIDYLALHLEDVTSRVTAAEGDITDLVKGDQGLQWKFEEISVSSADIASGYVDLEKRIKGQGIIAYVNRVPLHLNYDFTLSDEGSGSTYRTRLHFTGAIEADGDEALVEGDHLYITYCWASGDYPA